jgi:hypothetical protein
MRVFAAWLVAHITVQCLLASPWFSHADFETAVTTFGFFVFWWALCSALLYICAVSALSGEYEISKATGLATLLFTLCNWLMGVIVFMLRRLPELSPAYIHTGSLFQLAVLACVLMVMEYYVVRQQQLKGLAASASEKEIEEEKRVLVCPVEKED